MQWYKMEALQPWDEKVQWLRTQLMEGTEDDAVDLPVVHHLLQQRFPNTSLVAAVRITHQAFPSSSTKRVTHQGKKIRQLVGVSLRFPSCSWPPPLIIPSASVPSVVSLPQPISATAVQPTSQLLWELHSERSRRLQLEAQVQHLSLQVSQLQQLLPEYRSRLQSELDGVASSRLSVVHGPDSDEHLAQFTIDGITQDLKNNCPQVYELVQEVARTQRNVTDDTTALPLAELKGVMAMCTLLNARSNRVKGIQLLISLMLIARATNKQAITLLNQAGVCLSYAVTWRYLLSMTRSAGVLERVKVGHWIWCYDNLNIHCHVRHERRDHHSQMLNVTSRLAVSIRNTPDEIDWADSTPQGRRADLTVDDILPSVDDAAILRERAERFLTHFLVSEFQGVKDLQRYVSPLHQSDPVPKTNVVPMKILFNDEKYAAENVAILRRLVKDADLGGSDEILVGDQMTCKNIRSAQSMVQGEIKPIETLKWAHEVPGDFHFLWECLRLLLSSFWGSASTPGSLYHLREVVQRHKVDQKGKVFSVADEFTLHCFKAHLLANLCHQLKIDSPLDPIPHEVSREWLSRTVSQLLQGSIMPSESTDSIYSLHRSFLYTGFLYQDLRQAIRYEEGGQIIRHWKLWLPMFLGSKCHNCAREAVNLIANLKADYPAHIAYSVTHNQTVNVDGRAGHGKPIDQMVEHYNLIIKEAIRSAGANMTTNHLEDVSLCGLFLLEAAKKADSVFKVPPPSTQHSVRDASHDLQVMTADLLSTGAVKEEPTRTTPPFHDLSTLGMETKASRGWIESVLHSAWEEEEDESSGQHLPDREVDLEYELHHTP